MFLFILLLLYNLNLMILTLQLHIDKRNLLPPLLVIQTLAHNSTATLAVVKVCVSNSAHPKGLIRPWPPTSCIQAPLSVFSRGVHAPLVLLSRSISWLVYAHSTPFPLCTSHCNLMDC